MFDIILPLCFGNSNIPLQQSHFMLKFETEIDKYAGAEGGDCRDNHERWKGAGEEERYSQKIKKEKRYS